MLRVVFDTNVYISAFIFSGSRAEEAYELAVAGKVELFSSVPILTETARKLREKFSWNDDRITTALKHISKVSVVIKPGVHLEVLKDMPDNRVLECAQAAKAHLIVTGDKHLLDLKEYAGIGITRISGFLYSVPKWQAD